MSQNTKRNYIAIKKQIKSSKSSFNKSRFTGFAAKKKPKNDKENVTRSLRLCLGRVTKIILLSGEFDNKFNV